MDTKMRLAEHLPEYYGRVLSKRTEGYLTRSRFLSTIGEYGASMAHTQLGGCSAFSPRTPAAGILNVALAVFSLLWITIYAAQLTANLTISELRLPVEGIHDLVEAQRQGRVGAACSQGGAAYTQWVQTNFPTIDLHTDAITVEEMIAALDAGRCESIILTSPDADIVAADCGLNTVKVGEPLRFGPQDFAVGVRSDLSDVQVALSYWIQELRGCSPAVPGACYRGTNLDGLYTAWYSATNCAAGRELKANLGPENFLYVYFLCWVSAGLAVLWELSSLRFRDRIVALLFGSGLWECVSDGPIKCLDPTTKMICLPRLKCQFRRCSMAFLHSKEGADEYLRVIRCLRRFLVGPDGKAWQLLRAAEEELKEERDVYMKKVEENEGVSSRLREQMMRQVVLNKFDHNPAHRAAMLIALVFRTRHRERARMMRITALFQVQEDELEHTLVGIAQDRAKGERDKEYSELIKAARNKSIRKAEHTGTQAVHSSPQGFSLESS